MKVVVFEHPRIPSYENFNDIANTPLWSCLMGGYAAAGLKENGADVTYLDHAQPGSTLNTSLSRLLSLAPDLLLVNAVYFWEQTARLFEFFQSLRDLGFTGHINLFGFFPSLVHEQILLEMPAIDSIAVGECEHTLTALWQDLENKGGSGLRGISGLATRTEAGSVSYTARPVEKDPDLFPFPLRVEHPDSIITILASRGCYNRCSFCLVPPFDELHGGWRGRSPENIIAEIRKHTEKGHSDFYFSDPNFIGPGRQGRERTLHLLAMLRELDITYGMETRPNDLDEDMMRALVDSGLTSLLIGVESGSAAQLRRLNKHSSAETASTAISVCRKNGIDPEIGFLMFLPDSDLDDLKMNFSFLQKNELLTRLDRTANLFCHRQIILRGTSGYTAYRQNDGFRTSGIFGFEGIAPFQDSRVDSICRVILFACHIILREMMCDRSPIHWQNPSPGCSNALNSYLVELFSKSLEAAEDIDTNHEKNVLEKDISRLLKKGH